MGAGVTGHLFDTNILIYYFADAIPLTEVKNVEQLFKSSFSISIITKIEFLGFEKFTQNDFSQEREFLGHATVIPLTDDIADIAIDLRRKSRIKLPDAIIAATCLHSDLTLITRNEKDFSGIRDLTIYNPFPSE